MKSLVSRLRGNDKTTGISGENRLAAIWIAVFFLVGLCNTTTLVAQVKVRVETISGEPVTGRFLKLTKSQIDLQIESGGTQPVLTSDILSISATDFNNVATPPLSATPWTLLSTGERLRMTPLLIDDESIVAKWSQFTALPPVSLPLELCRGIVMSVPSSPMQQGRSFDRLFNHREDVDRITLSNGDRIDGEFVSLIDEHFALETGIGEVRTKVDQTQSMTFNPELVSQPAPGTDFAVLMLADGSTLHVRSIVSDGDLIIAESTGGFELSIPITALRTLRFFDSNRVDLTGVEPSATTVMPYFSMRREPKTDCNVLGGFMTLRGKLMATGFGVISGTKQTWQLDQKYQQFRATVGIDDAAQEAGSVRFQIITGETIAWQSEVLTGSSPPVTVPPIDLSKVGELSLVVQFADQGSVLDYANWCEPVLIRRPIATDD